ncbi:MAG: hypothetical protein U0694_28215 [Anaerolineae bacterium]
MTERKRLADLPRIWKRDCRRHRDGRAVYLMVSTALKPPADQFSATQFQPR